MKFHVGFCIEVPDGLDVTGEQVKEWAEFMCGYSGMMDTRNPLEDESFDPLFGTFEVKRL
jgi:hypothetical protein